MGRVRVKKVCIVNLNVFSLFCPTGSAPMGGAELDMYNLAQGLKKYSFLRALSVPFVLFRQLYRTNADIYISSGAGPEVGLVSLFCMLKRKKYIYRTASEIDCNRTYVKRCGFNGLLFELGLFLSTVIVTSVKSHQILIRNSYPMILKRRVSYIPLGINVTLNKIDYEKKKYILWIARGNSYKRPDIFLEIAQNIPEENFLMIMPEQSSEKLLYERTKNEAAGLRNVKFIGGVQFSDSQKYYDRARLFVNTSTFEGFTFTLIQSGIAHTPVAYLSVNPDNVITRFNIGEFGEGNIEVLTKKIKSLLKNKRLWNEKSNSIHDYVVANHDINKLSKKWIGLIDLLI